MWKCGIVSYWFSLIHNHASSALCSKERYLTPLIAIDSYVNEYPAEGNGSLCQIPSGKHITGRPMTLCSSEKWESVGMKWLVRRIKSMTMQQCADTRLQISLFNIPIYFGELNVSEHNPLTSKWYDMRTCKGKNVTRSHSFKRGLRHCSQVPSYLQRW